MKTENEIKNKLLEVRRYVEIHRKARDEHIESGQTLHCDYFTHQVRMWEYFRGQEKILTEVLDS